MVYGSSLKFNKFERTFDDDSKFMDPKSHATASGYNLVIIDCCCGQSNVSSLSTTKLNLQNIMLLCVNGSTDINRTFAHELGHIMGSDDAYNPGGVDLWTNNIMNSLSTGVDYRNFDHIFEGRGVAGMESRFLTGGWENKLDVPPGDVQKFINEGKSYHAGYPKETVGIPIDYSGYVKF